MKKKTNFWQQLKHNSQPILVLAPMAGFTDSSFRQICQSYGAQVIYSEMVSATALHYSLMGKSKDEGRATYRLLEFDKKREKNFVVQLFGAQVDHFVSATKIVTTKVKPAGIDINFGCPVPKVNKQGAGAKLMQDLALAKEIAEAVLANTDLPVSIKIRAASGKVEASEFLQNLSHLDISALMVHTRTLKQGFSGKAKHSLIRELRPYFNGVIITNGEINDLSQAQVALEASQADGLALARGALARPILFKEIRTGRKLEFSQAQIFPLMQEQARAVIKAKGEKALLDLRKQLIYYTSGLKQAKQLRQGLAQVETYQDLERVLVNYSKDDFIN